MLYSGYPRHRVRAPPASTAPLPSRRRTRASSFPYASSTTPVSRTAAAYCAATAPASSGIRTLSESMTPVAVRPTACWRAAGSCARWVSQARRGATAVVGSRPLPPPADSGSSGMVKRGTSPRPARVSRAAYCRDTSAITW